MVASGGRGMSFSTEAWQGIGPLYDSILQLPFNQELAAGACLDLAAKDPIVICALDTDGTDGPTSLAGAITDGSTQTRASEKGYDLYQMLMEHDIATALTATGDAVGTGPTGTNVNDLVVCVVL